MASGLPDWNQGVAVNIAVQSPTSPSVFVCRPQGTGRVRNGALTNLSTYTTIVSYVPAAVRQTYLAKVSAYCVNLTQFQMLVGGSIVSEAIAGPNGWYVDFFPWGQYIEANGTLSLLLQALSLTKAETLYGIILYEDVLGV